MINSSNRYVSAIPPVTKLLLLLNVLCWLATMALQRAGIVDLNETLGLHFWLADNFNPVQLGTYMFLHAGFTHIFFNMFSLFIFGITLERALGAQRYLFYYLSCGIGAALIQQLAWHFSWQDMFVSNMAMANATSPDEITTLLLNGQLSEYAEQFKAMLVTVGASGAVFGILLAFGMLFPNVPMYIIPFPFPIKAKYMVLGYGAFELFFGVTGRMDHIAHFAHLGGMLFGFLILMYWRSAARNNSSGGYGNDF